jgi:hypothetical protein|uniref:Uncharacterized protein n=1 Tax=Zea mays TaxID=4577 RepID=B4FM11_MAIZE|nr:unknown [Zea mays]
MELYCVRFFCLVEAAIKQPLMVMVSACASSPTGYLSYSSTYGHDRYWIRHSLLSSAPLSIPIKSAFIPCHCRTPLMLACSASLSTAI